MKTKLIMLALAALPLLNGCAAVVVGGVAGGALLASDRRTSGAYVDDQAMEAKAISWILQTYGTQVHVNVTAYNRKLLLTGEVPDAKTRAAVENLMAKVENQNGIYNELAVAPNSALKYRNMDTWITTQVRAQMLNSEEFTPNRVKVVTEDAVVYLLGLVTQKEAQAAAKVAAGVPNVRKVTTYFEYVD